jgi:very-short-patch-repair endonuclease
LADGVSKKKKKMTWDEVKSLARELRKNQTKEESLIWKNLRNRRFSKVKFFRQHPIEYFQHGKRNFFIVDFYSSEASLVIEIDGGIHNTQKDYDEQRDQILTKKGLTVLRFTNEELNNNIDRIFDRIKKQLK